MIRLRVLLPAALVLAGALGACSDGTETGSGTPGRTVDTAHGPVDVPDTAERVVTADWYGAFTVVDLGVEPVGVIGSYEGVAEPYAGALAGAASVGSFEELDFEAIVAAEPDVIVRTTDTDEATYERLSEIAPTVEISFQQLSLPEVTQELGDALGRSAQADEVVGGFEERAAGIAADHEELLENVTFVLATPTGDGSWWLYGRPWTDLTVLTEAGLRLAPPADELEEQTATYSLEELTVLSTADVILIDETWDNAELTGSRLWQGLPAVEAGRVHSITTGTSSTGHAMELLDRFEEILTELETG